MMRSQKLSLKIISQKVNLYIFLDAIITKQGKKKLPQSLYLRENIPDLSLLDFAKQRERASHTADSWCGRDTAFIILY